MFSPLTQLPPQPRKRSRLTSGQFHVGSSGSTGTDTQAPPRKRTRIASAQLKASESQGTNGTVVVNGNGSIHKDIPMREARPTGIVSRGGGKSESSVILSKTPKYTIARLTSFPEKLRKASSGELRAFFRLKPYSHLAITVNSESVLIWDCSSSSSSLVPRSLTLPYPLKSSERLPLACAVVNASKDLGVVLVYPDTGKITYWGNIESAESLKLFDKRREGAEGAIKIWGSEYIVNVIDTETIGLVLLTSHGRLAHVKLQDSYGHPQIAANFLQGGAKSSFIGGLVNSLGPWMTRISAVKSRQVTKGRVEIIALEEEGKFKAWEASESSQPNFIGEYDFSHTVRAAISELGLNEGEQKFGLQFLNFSQVRTISSEVLNDTFALHCILVAQVDLASKSRLVVLEAMITSSRQAINRVLSVNVYDPVRGGEKLDILFSGLDETICLVQGLSIVLLSWPLPKETIEDGPVRLVKYFQDVVSVSSSKARSILAVATEEQHHAGTLSKRASPSILIFTKSAGLLRLTPTAYNPKVHSPTAESKLEQKIFFGKVHENVLDLDDFAPFSYSTEDIELAALRLSANVLRTGIEFLPQTAPSMDQHLTLRMKALQDLATYLKKAYPKVSRATKWKLLFDAEKVAAARAIWRSYDQKLGEKGKDITLLEEAIDAAIERHKDDNRSDIDDTDDVRLWFIRHLNNLEKLFPVCFGLIKARTRTEDIHTSHMLRLAQEMHDLVVSALGTAFEFRQRNVLTYGLENEELEDGIIAAGYEYLPKFWTSDADIIKAVSWSIDLSHKVVNAVLQKAEDSKKISEAIVAQARQLALGMDVVVKLSCKAYMEAYRWLLVQESEGDRNKGIEMKTMFETTIRKDQIVALYAMGQGQRGLLLAEELEDVAALVELSLLELDDRKADAEIERNVETKKELKRVEDQIAHYFRKFGQRYARPFYQGQVSSHRLADLIDKDMGLHDQRTTFLRSEPTYAKLSWINEAVNEDDLVQVGHSLMEVAKSRETNTWSKGLELSLAKLALRSVPGSREPSVAQNGTDVNEEAQAAHQLLIRNEREITVWKVQQQLYEHVRPTVLEAVDEEGALDNIMRSYATDIIKGHPALAQLLKLGFSDLISHRAMNAESLIDVLTLMDQIPGQLNSNDTEDKDLGIFRRETNLALQVLEASDLDSPVRDTMERLIWKRCLLRDDWTVLSKTSYKSDRNIDEKLMRTATFEAIRNGIKEGSPSISAQFASSIPVPENLLGAGSSPDDYLHRFPSEELRIPIAKDNTVDDQSLKTYLSQADVPGLLSRIKEVALEVVDEESSEKAEKANRYNNFVKAVRDIGHDETQIKEEEEEEEEEEEDGPLYSEEDSGNFDQDEDVEMQEG